MIDNTIIAQSNPKSPISEAYRVLRTNIQFSSLDDPIKTMIVTSAMPGEGKSTTIANMAVVFAQMGSKVLLVDCDLRKPKIHKLFNVSNKSGITNVLSEHGDYQKYIIKTEIENLDLLASGTIPPNPSEILGSNAMKEVLHNIRQQYDVILIDTPPVGTVTDAQILSTIVDGTIIVAASGQVKIDALQRAKNLLEKVNANILGVIINKLDRTANSYYYYYYYSNYYQQDDEENEKGKKRKRK